MSWVVTASNEEDGLCHIEEFETEEEAKKAVEKLREELFRRANDEEEK